MRRDLSEQKKTYTQEKTVTSHEMKEERYIRGLFSSYYEKHPIHVDGVEKREFGFGGWEKKIESRHMGFKTSGELMKTLKNERPLYVSRSAAYYEFPDARPMRKKNWLGCDLIFDLDAEPHTCGKFTCPSCLQKVKDETIKLVEDFLMPDFGVSKDEITVNFSVDYAEPILIKSLDHRVATAKIGELVDGLIRDADNVKHIQKNDGIVADVSKNGLEAAAFDLITLKMGFKRISKVIRHRINGDLYKITLTRGKCVAVTSGHSVFVLKNGRIYPTTISKIKIGDYLVVPIKIPDISFVPDMLEFYTSVVGRYKVSRDNGRMKLAGSPISLPSQIKPSLELFKLLGYYVSEGGTTCGRVTLSFGSKEESLIADSIDCIREVFGPINIRNTRSQSTSVQLHFGGKLGVEFFHLVGAGNRATNKRVPWIVFSAPLEYKKAFLRAYIAGDGHITKEQKIQMKTVSKNLANDLVLLLDMLGINASISTERTPGGRLINGRGYKLRESLCFRVSIHNLEGVSKLFRVRMPIKTLEHHPPMTIPTIESGIRKLWLSVKPKRNVRLRNAFTRKKHAGRKQFLEGIRLMNEYIEADKSKLILRYLKIRDHAKFLDIAKGTGTKKEDLRTTVSALCTKGLIAHYKDRTYGLTPAGEKWLGSLEKMRDELERLELIGKSDLGFLPIINIKKVKPTSNFVYDVSVPGHENFVGGFGGVILHNSGSRGYHVHVVNDAFKELWKNERREIADYVSGTGLLYERFFGKKGKLFSGPTPSGGGYGGKFARRMISRLGDVEFASYLSTKLKKKNNRERFITGIREGDWERVHIAKKDEKFLKLFDEMTEELRCRIDANVTADVSKLIRLPLSLHGGSGMAAVPVKDIDKFDPMRNAVVFSHKPIRIRMKENAPKVVMKGIGHGPYRKGEAVEAPEHLAVYLICKKSATLEQ